MIVQLPLACVVRAVDRLRPHDEAERLALARLFRIAEVRGGAAADLPSPEPESRDRLTEERPLRRAPASRGPRSTSNAPRRTRLFKVERAGREEWPSAVATAKSLPLEPPSRGGSRTEPLLPANEIRSVFIALLATPEPTGSLDVPHAVAEICQGRPLRRIPRMRRLTLARGVCALVDAGPAMAPFRDDVAALLGVLSETVGRSRLSVVAFETWPPALAYTPRKRLAVWPPQSGEPVVALSDIGLARTPAGVPRSELAVWADLAQQLGARSVPLAALVPLLPSEVPDEAARLIAIVTLGERTTARTARRARELAWKP